jgi:hypothetical protein
VQRNPPEPELQFDIGYTDDSLERMCALFARFGDIYRVYAPGRKAYVHVINHPDNVKRVLVSNHRNYTKGMRMQARGRVSHTCRSRRARAIASGRALRSMKC